jgi:hypothetical protein
LASGRGRDWLLGLTLTAALLTALLPGLHRPGAVFDEGAVLAYGERVLQGAIPHRDFETFYGPANPVVIAAAFAAGGTNQETERVVGAGYRLLAVLGTALLLLRIGRLVALASAAVMIPLFVPDGLPALASFAAVGCALMSLGLLALSRERRGLAAGAGCVAGVAVLMRPDWTPVLAVASAPLLLGGPASTKAYLAGLAPVALLGLADAILVGPARIGHVMTDLVRSEPARRLPIDLTGSEPGRLLSMALAGGLLASAAGLVAWRRGSREARSQAPAVVALGLLALGLVPYALSRMDYTHVVIPLLPGSAALAAAAGLAACARRVWIASAVPIIAAAGVFALLLGFAPKNLRVPVSLDERIVLGRAASYPHRTVRLGGRDFSLTLGDAPQAQLILDGAEREHRTGARTLFVGPQDLRRTSLNDAYFYYLLDDLRPATRFMELNPLVASRLDSGLAGELRHADLLILSHQWDNWDEPNASREFGSAAPNQVVLSLFCRVVRAQQLELLRRCR